MEIWKKPGYHDLNQDGIMDALVFTWNGRLAIFLSDDGKLPWPSEEERRDWNAYFNKAFCVGMERKNPWNELRAHWGSYTLLVDKNGNGRIGNSEDYCYRAFDLNGDGAPEAEYYHLFPGEDWCPFSNKFVVNLNGAREMSYLDFQNLTYPDEQIYGAGEKYIMNVHGSGFFLNSYSRDVRTSWETPIAWYDFDFDGFTNMTMRAADIQNNRVLEDGLDIFCRECYSGKISEFELAFELNGNTGPEKYNSLDMQLTFYSYKNPGWDYRCLEDQLPFMKAGEGTERLYGPLLETRTQQCRQYIPYLDGYRLGMEREDWEGVMLIFDEDDDDCRWEELFSAHEQVDVPNFDWRALADKLGDRTERDTDYQGRGRLYVGRFDGKIHLYHAEEAVWEVDYLGLYKGSRDHEGFGEGPEPPRGLRYPQVEYFDTTGNGFIDKIVYSTVEYGSEEASKEIQKVVSLGDYMDESMDMMDACPLFDPRVDTPLTGFGMKNWDGKALTEEDFSGSPVKNGYDKVKNFYQEVCRQMWDGAQMLYQLAREFGLNVSERLDENLQLHYSREELLNRKDWLVPEGYSRYLKAEGNREKYHNGYWLREKVFEDLCRCDRLNLFTLEKYYYTGRYEALCAYVRSVL